MTIDEAIKHCEEKAKQLEGYAEPYRSMENCEKCAEEHRQLAEWLKELKQLREQTRWIPVSERLPGDGKYLVTRGDVIGRPMIGMRYFSKDLSKVDEYEFESKKGVSGWCEYDSEYGWYIDDKVTAWMPLPEPYKAESENKE